MDCEARSAYLLCTRSHGVEMEGAQCVGEVSYAATPVQDGHLQLLGAYAATYAATARSTGGIKASPNSPPFVAAYVAA